MRSIQFPGQTGILGAPRGHGAGLQIDGLAYRIRPVEVDARPGYAPQTLLVAESYWESTIEESVATQIMTDQFFSTKEPCPWLVRLECLSTDHPPVRLTIVGREDLLR